MIEVIVKTAVEFYAAIKAGNIPVITEGEIEAEIKTGSPRIILKGTAKLRLSTRESSAPSVEAWGYAQLRLSGKVVATLSATCHAVIHGTKAKVKGGTRVHVKIKNAKDWCDYYGLTVAKGIAVLFKAVNNEYRTNHSNWLYQPGTTPTAPDWDGGKQECGCGLHFSPSPAMALEFNTNATKFIACPVRLKDIAIHPDGEYPQKCKAKGCCAPVWEVNRHGEKV